MNNFCFLNTDLHLQKLAFSARTTVTTNCIFNVNKCISLSTKGHEHYSIKNQYIVQAKIIRPKYPKKSATVSKRAKREYIHTCK